MHQEIQNINKFRYYSRLCICTTMIVLSMTLISICQPISMQDDDIVTCGEPVYDYEGNEYPTIRIGSQCWLMENLRTKHYKDGTEIRTIVNNTDWLRDNQGARAEYNNNEDYVETYGYLYNWYVVQNSKGICPANMTVPTDSDWRRLVNFIGSTNTGGLMKSTGTEYWREPNTGATNGSGFSALPAGQRERSGAYSLLGDEAIFWSSSFHANNTAPGINATYISSIVYFFDYQFNQGFSIRCVVNMWDTSIETNIDYPEKVELYQNYPNPFNPATQIRFSLPEAQLVTIQIYDVNGRMVDELSNNQLYSIGNHQIFFDGKDLPSGIYIYQMTTSLGISLSRKLLLIK